MGDIFKIFFELGFDHILDIEGYDHMLFLLALCIPFTLIDIKKVFLLATAFTIGHSITLALAVYNIVTIPSDLVEFLIPLTIVITVLIDSFLEVHNKPFYLYPAALIFGLIHGLGFSNFLRASMMPGKTSTFGMQLFGFNVGIEVAQLLVVLAILCVFYIIQKVFSVKRNLFTYIVSFIVGSWALYMCIDRFPF